MGDYTTPRMDIGDTMAIQIKGGEIAIENTRDFVKVVVWRDNVLEGKRVIMRAIVSETFMRRTGPKQLPKRLRIQSRKQGQIRLNARKDEKLGS